MTAPHEGHGRLTEAPRPDPLAWLRSPDWDQERLDDLCSQYSPCGQVDWDPPPPIDPRDYSFNCPCTINGLTDPDDSP